MKEIRTADVAPDVTTGFDDANTGEESGEVIFIDDVILLELWARTSGDEVGAERDDSGGDDVAITNVMILDVLTTGDDPTKYKNNG